MNQHVTCWRFETKPNNYHAQLFANFPITPRKLGLRDRSDSQSATQQLQFKSANLCRVLVGGRPTGP